MAYRLKDYLYNDKLTKEQNILMDRLYKLRMSGMAEAFEKQLPSTNIVNAPTTIILIPFPRILFNSFLLPEP